MEEYKSNSHNAKRNAEAREKNSPKVHKMVDSKDVVKKSTLRKIVDAFVSEDIHNVKSYLLESVIVPSIKNLLLDFITNGAHMLINGDTRGTTSSRSSQRNSYDRYYSNSRDRDADIRTKARWGFEDVILNDKRKAEEILQELDVIMEEYQKVRVADLNGMLGITGPYTEQYYGWTDIRTARIVPIRGGWVIEMPRAQALN